MKALTAVGLVLFMVIGFACKELYAGDIPEPYNKAFSLPSVIPEVPNAPVLPDFYKEPFRLFIDHAIFPPRIHTEWGNMPWAIFYTDEPKRNFIGVYYETLSGNEISIRYVEWVIDTDAGTAIRGYWHVNGRYIFDKEIPRPAENKKEPATPGMKVSMESGLG
ncbi:MAG: hypothetical protein HYW88_00950 [Candidatus Sungbacteria bacterium]|nr:hypothetical protein [Candidatus Sungbacteria bacterium]